MVFKRIDENTVKCFITQEDLQESGIRIEDDILITDNGCRVLGKPIPKTVKEIEEVMAS